MISQDVVLVRYGEITLKDSWTRQNRERILAGNIAFSLDRAGVEHKMERGEEDLSTPRTPGQARL